MRPLDDGGRGGGIQKKFMQAKMPKKKKLAE